MNKNEGGTPTPSELYTTEGRASRKRTEKEVTEAEPANAQERFKELLENAEPAHDKETKD